MPDASNGFVTAVTGVVSGLIVELLLKAFVSAGIISPSMIVLYQLVSILAILAFVHVTQYWGTLYLFGWWAGSAVMVYSGLIQGWEFVIYSIILFFVLISRFKRGFDE